MDCHFEKIWENFPEKVAKLRRDQIQPQVKEKIKPGLFSAQLRLLWLLWLFWLLRLLRLLRLLQLLWLLRLFRTFGPKTHFCFFTTSCDRKNRFKSSAKPFKTQRRWQRRRRCRRRRRRIHLNQAGNKVGRRKKNRKIEQNLGQFRSVVPFTNFLNALALWLDGHVSTLKLWSGF